MHKTSAEWSHVIPKKFINKQKMFKEKIANDLILPPLSLKNSKRTLHANDKEIASLRKSAIDKNNITNENMQKESSNINIRAFNWEGIHFEITPRNTETDSNGNQMTEHFQDMNLMNYNFNGENSSSGRHKNNMNKQNYNENLRDSYDSKTL